MKYLLTALTLVLFSQTHAQQYRKVFYDDVDNIRDYQYKHPHIKVVNETKVPASFTLFYRNYQGDITPIKYQNEKGIESAQAHKFKLEPGKGVFFLHDKYDFRNATDKCIVKVEARIIDPKTGNETGEFWYLDNKWCKEEHKGVFGNKLGTYYGYRVLLQDEKERGTRRLVTSTRK